MSDQNEEIYHSDNTLASIRRWIAGHVVGHIHHQKNRWTSNANLHQSFVQLLLFIFYGIYRIAIVTVNLNRNRYTFATCCISHLTALYLFILLNILLFQFMIQIDSPWQVRIEFIYLSATVVKTCLPSYSNFLILNFMHISRYY